MYLQVSPWVMGGKHSRLFEKKQMLFYNYLLDIEKTL